MVGAGGNHSELERLRAKALEAPRAGVKFHIWYNLLLASALRCDGVGVVVLLVLHLGWC